MKYHPKLALATADAESRGDGSRVWAEDLNADGAKRFCVATIDDFHSAYQRMDLHKRHFYEVIQGPPRLFIDLDGRGDRLALGGAAAKFTEAVVERLKVQYEIEVGYNEIAVLDACVGEKFSVHVIFSQVVFATIEALGEFIDSVLAECPNENVDRKVYTNNRCFRLAGSTKKGRDTPLQLYNREAFLQGMQVGRMDEISTDEGAALFSRLLVVPPTHDDVDLVPAEKVMRTGSSTGCWVSPEDERSKRLTLLVRTHFGVEIKLLQEFDGWIQAQIAGGIIPCPIKGGLHGRNSTVVRMAPNGSAYINCMDGDCAYHRRQLLDLID